MYGCVTDCALSVGNLRMSCVFMENFGNLTALFTKPPDGLPPYRTGSGGRSVRWFPIDIFPFCRERPVTKEPAAL